VLRSQDYPPVIPLAVIARWNATRFAGCTAGWIAPAS